jgi:predicted permease
MNYFTSLPARIKSWFRAATSRSHLESEMEAELAFHIESYTEDLIRRGLPPEEAGRRARIELGGIAVQKEEMRASLGLRLWDDLRADLRYAFRMLMKSPGFTAIAVGSLAMGIGANTAIFTIAKQLLMERLSVPHPEELRLFTWVGGDKVVVHSGWGDWDNLPGGLTTCSSFSYPVYQQLRSQNHSLSDLFAFKDISRVNATIDGHADVLQAEMVSGNYYQQLQVQPVLGRAIQPGDDAKPGSGAVALISYGLWQQRFGGSPSIIGKSITVNTVPFTIIGVNPQPFTGAQAVQRSPDIFLPFSMEPLVLARRKGSFLADDDFWWMQIMARVAPGTSEPVAQAALDTALNAAVRATMTVGKDDEIPRLALVDGSRGLNFAGKQFAQPVYVLISLTGLVLLLACANIANLLLARSAARQREMCVRLALGADRNRILRQVLVESLLLSSLGGVAGLLLGYFARNAIPHLLSNSWEPGPFVARFDWRVFAFTAAISIVTGLLFGVAPAWQATRTQVNSGLKDNALTATHRRKGFAGKAIVAFQVALSTLLVVGAFLFVRTLANLQAVDPGFRPERLLLFEIDPPESRYPAQKDVALYRQIEQKLATIPGVTAVTLSSEPLIANSMSNDHFLPVGQSVSIKKPTAFVNIVGSTFFETMAIPIVAGRGFAETDTETSLRVAVVNQALVRKYFPDTNPIGKTFTTGEKDPVVQIVGVSADAKYDSLRRDAPPTFYEPYRQRIRPMDMTYEVQTRMKPESIAAAARAVVQSIDKDLPLIDVRTQVQQIDETIQQERIFADLTAGFGILALTLASIGIYGIMAYTVAQRTNEIGIRLALGAQARQILTMVLREASWLAVIGVAVGLGASLLLTRFLASMLFGLKPNDPATLIGSAALLFAVALLAGFIPARRASRVQPMQALRHE